MVRQVIIEIDETGRMVEKTSGFVGRLCQEFSQKFKALMQKNGVDTSGHKETPTAEMYETQANSQQHY